MGDTGDTGEASWPWRAIELGLVAKPGSTAQGQRVGKREGVLDGRLGGGWGKAFPEQRGLVSKRRAGEKAQSVN